MRQIVLTGASRGLGRAMAEAFIVAGHTIHGCARSESHIGELRRHFPMPHTWDVVDVAHDRAVQNWASQVIGIAGAPDLLVNNAAIINRNASLWQVSAEQFDSVIDVNLKGVANVIRHFVPEMVARGSGVVVNFSSGWGRSTAPEVAPYCATKWAIEGLTQALAQELPAGMAAIALNPGIIDTDMLRSCFGAGAASYPDARQWAIRAVPLLLQLGPKDNGGALSIR